MSVTPLRARDNAVIVLARLKAASPASFAELITHIRAMHSGAVNDCVQAPLDKVQVMQGKAQQLTDLVALLEGCIEEAKALEAKMKERK